jgi:aminoglycoside phosphotransferase (APT) family kinase protein
MLESLQDIPFSFGLCHGDLAPRNLIPRDGAPVLIDWGTASTGPAPWTDVQQVYQWSVEDDVVTHAEFRAFAIAAGVHPEADGSVLDALMALRHLDLVRWAIVQRPELTIDYVRSAQRGLRADRR